MDITTNLVGGGDSSSEKYNKDTYIGYLKMKKGGMKIISGDKDEKIISVRNKILGHLDKVLSGGKRLKEKNIKKYFKALGGKYVRNDMCISGDNSNCKGGKNVSIEGAHKLLKLISKKNLPIESALDIFKGSAPQLYEKLENKIKGGHKGIKYDNDSSGGGGGDDCKPAQCDVGGITVKLDDSRHSGDFRELSGFQCGVAFDVDYFNNYPQFRAKVLDLLNRTTGLMNSQFATSAGKNGRTWADLKAFLSAAESELVNKDVLSEATYLAITKQTGLIKQITNTPYLNLENCEKGENAIEDKNEFMHLLGVWGFNKLKKFLLNRASAREYDANYKFKSKKWQGGYNNDYQENGGDFLSMGLNIAKKYAMDNFSKIKDGATKYAKDQFEKIKDDTARYAKQKLNDLKEDAKEHVNNLVSEHLENLKKDGGYDDGDYNNSGGYDDRNYDNHGGYDDRNYNNRGGYDDRDYNNYGGYGDRDYNNRRSYDDKDYNNSGGYDDRDYNNNGGYDKYYNNMYGGFNLRQQILDIKI
jgi:hypothetical protein